MKGTVRLDLSYERAESLGFWLYDYTLKYEINGAKFRRKFKSRKAADDYSAVLADNGILSQLSAKRHRKSRARAG